MDRIGLLLAALLAPAWLSHAAPAPERRAVSLDECLKLALEHNLDLQIERMNPAMRSLDLWGAYSAYDPSFSAQYNHSYRLSPGGFNPQTQTLTIGTEDNTDSGGLGLGGLLPTGLQYSLSGSAYHSYGLGPGTTDARIPYRDSQGTAGISLTQPILKNFWIDGARYSIALRKKDLKISEYTLQRTVMQTVTSTEIAYYNLIAAIEQVKVQMQAVAEAEQQLKENKKRVEVGVMAPLDEKDAESQVAASRANLLVAQTFLATSQNQLKSLVTDKYADWESTELEPTETLSTVPTTFSRADSWSKAMTMRPELLQTRLELEKLHLTLKYDKNQLFPQLDLKGSYGQLGKRDDYWDAMGDLRDAKGNNFSYGVVLTMPLSNRQARYNYRLAKEQIEQALLQLKRQEQEIMHQVDDAIAQAKSTLEQVEARRQASKYAQAAYEAEQKKLENGKSTSFQVLVLQRILTQRRYEEISAMAEYNRALADLSLKEGTTLDRRGIAVNSKP